MVPGQDAHQAADVVLTPEEAARELRLSVRTLRRYDADGSGPPRVRLGTRRIGYWRNDVCAWLRARTAPTKQQRAA